jgi:hypothetical protein
MNSADSRTLAFPLIKLAKKLKVHEWIQEKSLLREFPLIKLAKKLKAKIEDHFLKIRKAVSIN